MPGIGSGKNLSWDEVLSRTETRLAEVTRRAHDETTSEKARAANAQRVIELTARINKLKNEGPSGVAAGISVATAEKDDDDA